MAQRSVSIDILKGMAILLIVYGHIIPGTIPFLTEYVSTFHIPLFFFVSGMLYNEDKYKDSFKSFFISRSKSILAPFSIFSFIVALLYMCVVKDYPSFLMSLFSNGWGGYALWFVPVLFFTELCFYPIRKMKKGWICLVLILCMALSFLSSKLWGLVPHNLMLVFCGVFFYGIGNICKTGLFAIQKMNSVKLSLVASASTGLSLLYIPFSNGLPEWFINKIPSMIFYTTPLFAICALTCISVVFERVLPVFLRNFLCVCGKQTFIILAFHQIICMIAQQYVSSKVAILIMIVVLTFLVWFIPGYLPWMLGKSKVK